MIKIRTYFITDEKTISGESILEFLFEFIYMTILPSLGVYLFFITKNLLFFSFLLFPAFLKIKLQPKQLSSDDMKYKGRKK